MMCCNTDVCICVYIGIHVDIIHIIDDFLLSQDLNSPHHIQNIRPGKSVLRERLLPVDDPDEDNLEYGDGRVNCMGCMGDDGGVLILIIPLSFCCCCFWGSALGAGCKKTVVLICRAVEASFGMLIVLYTYINIVLLNYCLSHGPIQ
jgi:hypothetical protein